MQTADAKAETFNAFFSSWMPDVPLASLVTPFAFVNKQVARMYSWIVAALHPHSFNQAPQALIGWNWLDRKPIFLPKCN
jgi:uncharacterized membrane protein